MTCYSTVDYWSGLNESHQRICNPNLQNPWTLPDIAKAFRMWLSYYLDSLWLSRGVLNGITHIFIRDERGTWHTWKRRQCDHWGRDRSEVGVSQGRLPSTRCWKKQRTRSHIQRECGLSDTLIFCDTNFGLLATRTGCKYIFLESPYLSWFVIAAIGN